MATGLDSLRDLADGLGNNVDAMRKAIPFKGLPPASHHKHKNGDPMLSVAQAVLVHGRRTNVPREQQQCDAPDQPISADMAVLLAQAGYAEFLADLWPTQDMVEASLKAAKRTQHTAPFLDHKTTI